MFLLNELNIRALRASAPARLPFNWSGLTRLAVVYLNNGQDRDVPNMGVLGEAVRGASRLGSLRIVMRWGVVEGGREQVLERINLLIVP